MPLTYDLKSDIRFKQGKQEGIEEGIEKGIEKGIEQGIEKGIEKTKIETVRKILGTKKFTDEQIAELLEVSPAFVKKVKRDLAKPPKKTSRKPGE